MKIKITLGLFLAAFLLSAQTAKMNRDIEVAEKILETIVEETTKVEESGITIFGHQRVSGSYIDGFGALFTISSNSLTNPVIWTENKKTRFKSEGNIFRLEKGESFDEEDLKDKAAIKADFKKIAETFFFEYAYLLRALGADDKLMIQYGGSGLTANNDFPRLIIHGKKKRKYTATITKKTINQYQENKQKLIAAIEYVFEEANDKKNKEEDMELSLLSTILKKLYQGSEKDELYISMAPSYERIEGIGAIFNLNIREKGGNRFFDLGRHSRTIWEDGNLVIIDANKKGKDDKEEERTVGNLDENYDEFVANLKSYIVEYGSIIKSLKTGEQLLFKLSFPNCRDCEKMPRRLEIAAKKATLDAYRKDQVSLEKAVNQLVVK